MSNRKLAAINLILLISLFVLTGKCMALPSDIPNKITVHAKPVPNSIKDYEGMVWEGHISAQKDKFIKVVVNETAWNELWMRAFNKPAPEVDFENYAVACVFLGHSADWLYSIGFGQPFERDNLLVVPYGLAEIILELAGPFKASGQYHMKVYKKRKGFEMVLEDTSGSLK